MSLDGTTIGAILGFFGTVATVLGGIYLATRNRDGEKKSAALLTLEKTRDEANAALIALKDEQLADLKNDLVVLKAQLLDCESENDTLGLENNRLRADKEGGM